MCGQAKNDTVENLSRQEFNSPADEMKKYKELIRYWSNYLRRNSQEQRHEQNENNGRGNHFQQPPHRDGTR
jgi:hypothetical protein